MPSGAGLNRWGVQGGIPLLLLTSNATVITPKTQYGTIPTQDSGWYCTPVAYSKLVFQLIGASVGYEVTVYGTLDPACYQQYLANHGVDGFTTPVLASSSGVLPAPSEQTGTGPIGNPLTSDAPFLYVSMPLVGVRVALTGITAVTGQGNASVLGFAVP